MSIKQDYIMKLIDELIVALKETILGLTDKQEVSESFSNFEKSSNDYEKLKNLVDDGKINEAENYLFEIIRTANLDDFKLAVLFYDYLNSKTDEFLENNDFSREEIKDGIVDASKKFGYDNMISIYLM